MSYNFRREEPFRYEFEHPIEASFKIIKVNDKDIESKTGHSNILDISPNGLKLITKFDLQVEENKKIEIQTTFTLNSNPITLPGFLMWQNFDYVHQKYMYGVQFDINEHERQSLIDELKLYAKGIAVIKNKK